jgi:hypothetical protein
MFPLSGHSRENGNPDFYEWLPGTLREHAGMTKWEEISTFAGRTNKLVYDIIKGSHHPQANSDLSALYVLDDLPLDFSWIGLCCITSTDHHCVRDV